MSFPQVQLPFLPPNTIVPNPVDQTDEFIRYLNRLYEDIAFAMNQKDFTFFEISISNAAEDIPNLPNFGAFFVAVSGTVSGQPAATWALVKSDVGIAGVGLVPITFQAGTGAWAGNILTITSPAPGTNYQIAHNRATTPTFSGSANFNIRIVGIQ